MVTKGGVAVSGNGWWMCVPAAVAVFFLLLLLPFLLVLRLSTAPPGLSASDRVLLWLPAAASATDGRGFPTAFLLGTMLVESGGWALATDHNCSNERAAGWLSCGEVYGGGVHTVSEDAGLMQVNSGGWPPPAVPTWKRYGLYPDPMAPRHNIQAGAMLLSSAFAVGPSLYCVAQVYHRGACDGGGGGGGGGYAARVEDAFAHYQDRTLLDVWAGKGPRKGEYPARGPSLTLYAVGSGPFGAESNFGPAGTLRQVIPPERLYAAVPGQVICTGGKRAEKCVQVEWPLQLETVGKGITTMGRLFYPGMSVWMGKVNLNRPPSRLARDGSGAIRVVAEWFYRTAGGKRGQTQAQAQAETTLPVRLVHGGR